MPNLNASSHGQSVSATLLERRGATAPGIVGAAEHPSLNKSALPPLDDERSRLMDYFYSVWEPVSREMALQGAQLAFTGLHDLRGLFKYADTHPYEAEWLRKFGTGLMGRIDQNAIERHERSKTALESAGMWPFAREHYNGTEGATSSYSDAVWFAVDISEPDGQNGRQLRQADKMAAQILQTLERFGLNSEQARLVFLQPDEFHCVIERCKKSQIVNERINAITENTEAKMACYTLLRRAVEAGASDVHIELLAAETENGRPSSTSRESRTVATVHRKTEYRVRFRIDGVLEPASVVHRELALLNRFSSDLAGKIINVLKGWTNKIDIAEHRKGQDGEISMDLRDLKRLLDRSEHGADSPEYTAYKAVLDGLSLRVATCLMKTEGETAETMVLRLHRSDAAARISIEQMGYRPDQVMAIKKLIDLPTGIILVTGPTGSGKSTTLYSMLETLNTPDTKILTAEDPVERIIQGVQQVQINENDGYVFHDVLKRFLRLDPDVILIGEMRDSESAFVAVNASMTGHLVLSTLHTNSAIEAVGRLTELGIKPGLLGDTLAGVIGQRLVRRLCPDCREAYDGRDELNKLFGQQLLAEPVTLYRPGPHHVECACCDHRGYRGRCAIAEVWVPTEEEKSLIHSGATGAELVQKALNGGFKTMPMAGLEAALEGTTSLKEVQKYAAKYDQFRSEAKYMVKLLEERLAAMTPIPNAETMH